MYQIPLSPYSKQFYTEWKLNQEKIDDYIMSDQYLEGNFDVDRFDKAIKRFINDYLLFNSHIEGHNGQLYWIKNNEIYGVDYFKKSLTNNEIFSYIKKPFNLEKGPLYRFAIINNGFNKYRLIMMCHHIIINGIASYFFLKEVSNYYNDENYKSSISLDTQLLKTTELFTRLSKNVESNKNSHKAFWKEQLAHMQKMNLDFLKLDNNKKNLFNTTSQNLNLPMDQTTRVGEIRFGFGKETLTKLNKLKKLYKTTPYLYGQNIYAILINLYTGQDKFCVNYSISIPESFHFIYGAQINTTLIPYNFNKTNNVVDVIEQSKHFYHSLKQDGIKHTDLPIDEVLSLSNADLLNFAFDQAYVRITSIEFDNIESKINYEINIDLYNKLWFGQELYQEEVYFSVLYNLDFIDISLLKIFINCYKQLFIEILDELIKLDNNPNLELKEIESRLLNYEEAKQNIALTRKLINKNNIATNANWEPFDQDYNSLEVKTQINQEDIQQILDWIEKISQTLSNEKEVMLVIGDEGEKNTLINYLTAQQIQTEINIEDLSDDSIIEPYKLWRSPINRQIYCSCPRYWIIDNPVENIISAFFIKRLFDITEKIKLIVVIPFSYLENRGNAFINLTDKLGRLFNDLSDFKNGLLLIITQVGKNISPEYIKDEIADILKNQEINLNLKQVKILEFFASRKEKNIALYKSYRKEAKIAENDRETILQAIGKTKFINKEGLVPLISEKSMEYIPTLFNNIQEQILKDFDNLINDIKSFYKKLLNKDDFYNINSLIKYTQYLVKELKDVDFLKNIYNTPDQTNFKFIAPILKKIQRNFTAFAFCKQITKGQCRKQISIESIKKSLNITIDFMLGNTINNIEKETFSTLDNFIKNIENYINQQEMPELKKSINILEIVEKKLRLYDNLIEIRIIIQNDFKSISSNTDQLITYVDILQNIDSEHKNTFIERLKTSIELIHQVAKNKLKILQHVLCININRLFKEFCNHIVKSYNSYDINQLERARNVINKLGELISFFQTNQQIRLLCIIENIEKEIILNLPQLNNSVINDLIIKLKKLQEDTVDIKELSTHKYIEELSRVYNTIQINYQNLSSKSKYVEIPTQKLRLI